MCVDRRGMRSLSAHKGWRTRRARAALKQPAHDPPIEGGLYSRAERERGKALAALRATDQLEEAEQLVEWLLLDFENHLREVLLLIDLATVRPSA